jgi:hydroxyethylthiazole kinase-like uncharacterized protein yjeF
MARADTAVRATTRVRAVTPALLEAHPIGPAAPHADKESRGSVLVIGGGRGSAGAVRLAGEAALRAGAGKLQIATAAAAAAALTVTVPEALVIGLAETRSGDIRRTAARALASHCADADAVVVGPGMMDEAEAVKLVARLSFRTATTLVLDAGALGACAVARKPLPADTVITPHDGELKKLAKRLDLDPERDAQALGAAIAARCGVICVAKGPTTWIATPDGGLFRHVCAIPGLGMSGSGDVLAGLLAGLAARTGNALHASLWAVHLHAAAGRALERRIGRLGFLARELSAEIPRLLPAGS